MRGLRSRKGMGEMQPKPIDSRHLIDVDAQKRLVNTAGVQHLHGVREEKEHPAETDYDAVHDEASRRYSEETSRQLIEELKKARKRSKKEETKASEANQAGSKPLSNSQTGCHLDVEA